MEISKFRAMIILGDIRQHEYAASEATSRATKDAHRNKAQSLRDALADAGWEIVSVESSVRRIATAATDPRRECSARCDCETCRPELYV